MGTASLGLETQSGWRELWLKWAPPCGEVACGHNSGWLKRWRGRAGRVLFQGTWFCAEGCLERAAARAVQRLSSTRASGGTHHRIPLGLLLLSRQQLTVEQLRVALEAQRAAGRGKIGEWLQELGFVTELQVTAAVARQWSCPLLRMQPVVVSASLQLPFTLMRSFSVLPVDFVASSGTLHIACRDGIDYGVLYAIEQMLGVRTEACMAPASMIDRELRMRSERRGESEIVFERSSNEGDLAAIICNYCRRIAVTELRLSACGPHLWARLFRAAKCPIDLLFLGTQSLAA